MAVSCSHDQAWLQADFFQYLSKYVDLFLFFFFTCKVLAVILLADRNSLFYPFISTLNSCRAETLGIIPLSAFKESLQGLQEIL